ncbi:MAG: metal-dependent hydrolase [Candidatus Hermodarchaeota archaeon]
MTELTTHLGLASILFWTLIGQNERNRFKNKKFLFWIVAFFSVLPDLDIFFAMHRGPSHSLVFPTFMIFTGLTLHSIFKSSFLGNISSKKASTAPLLTENDSTKDYYAFISRCIMYGGLFWVSHIFLDWEHPLALFYPFSDRVYVVSFILLLDIIPILFFPVKILGLFFEISGVPYLRGLAVYFINWLPQDRVAAFGTSILAIPIRDFLLHAFIFAIFVVYVAIPNLPKPKKLSIPAIVYQIDLPVLGGGLIILIIGVLMGPALGSQIIDSQTIRSSLIVSEDSFSPAIAVNFEPTNFLLDPSVVHQISAFFNTTSNKTFTGDLLIAPSSEYETFIEDIEDSFANYNISDPQDAIEFNKEYKQAQSALIATVVKLNSSDLSQLSLNMSVGAGLYSIIYVINDWNTSALLNEEILVQSVELQVSIITPRNSIYLVGWLLILSGIAIMLIATIKNSLETRLTKRIIKVDELGNQRTNTESN